MPEVARPCGDEADPPPLLPSFFDEQVADAEVLEAGVDNVSRQAGVERGGRELGTLVRQLTGDHPDQPAVQANNRPAAVPGRATAEYRNRSAPS